MLLHIFHDLKCPCGKSGRRCKRIICKSPPKIGKRAACASFAAERTASHRTAKSHRAALYAARRLRKHKRPHGK